MRTIVCITAKDEAATIGPLVRELLTAVDDVIVVNDGSWDDTGACAEEAGAFVLAHDQPWGIGPSLLQAWRVALGQGAERIVQMDAGGSHLVSDLPTVLHFSSDIVIGSRFVWGAKYKGRWWRAWISRIVAAACNVVTGASIWDWTSGYRAFTREVVELLLAHSYHAKMHGWQIEVLGHALQLGLSVEEVPITYQAGGSSLNWKAAAEAVVIWSRL
jgi:dolichol-phosphate mannosyltransferase